MSSCLEKYEEGIIMSNIVLSCSPVTIMLKYDHVWSFLLLMTPNCYKVSHKFNSQLYLFHPYFPPSNFIFQGNDPIVQTFLLCNLSCISYDDMDVYVITCFESIQRPRLKCFSMTCLSHRSCMKNKLRFNVRSIEIKMNVKF